jgi:hypothetical protein
MIGINNKGRVIKPRASTIISILFLSKEIAISLV